MKGLDAATCRARSVYSRSHNPLFAWGTDVTITRIVPHPEHDLALLQMVRRATADRAVPMAARPLDIAEHILLFGYAGGTAYTFCDDLLGEGSPKTPTPVVVDGIVAGLIPHTGSQVRLYMSNVTTHGGNSGGPLVSCEQKGVAAVHIAGSGG